MILDEILDISDRAEKWGLLEIRREILSVLVTHLRGDCGRNDAINRLDDLSHEIDEIIEEAQRTPSEEEVAAKNPALNSDNFGSEA